MLIGLWPFVQTRQSPDSAAYVSRSRRPAWFWFSLLGLFFWFDIGGQALGEGLGRSAVHAAALVRALSIVDDHVGIERGLHSLDGFEPRPAAFDAEVPVQEGAVQTLDEAVGLGPLACSP